MYLVKKSKTELFDHLYRLTYQLEEADKNDADINSRLEELERFYKVIIYRELRAIEMKNAMVAFTANNTSVM